VDIFEFAMEKERRSENLYRALAGETNEKGLAAIFTMLADEEAHHYVVIEQMRSKIPESVSKTDVLADAGAVFDRMRKGASDFDFDASQADIYRKAQEMEQQNKQYYLEKAEEVADTCHKGLFKKLADEENKHYLLLENIIALVSRPEYWLENAEFFNPEEY
jgi:rubrerythrin